MKNQYFKCFLALVVSICFFYKAGAQNIRAEAKLQQYTIRIGDQIKLFISVRQPVKTHVNFPALKDSIGKIQVVNTLKPDTLADKNDPANITITQGYVITCFDAGTYAIPPFSIGSEGGALKTNPLTLQVETVKVDTTKAFYDIKQPIAVTYTFFDWLRDNWYWVFGALAAIAAIIGWILYMRKRPKAEPISKVITPQVPPHVTALNKLKELRDKKLWQQGLVKEYYVSLSDVVREYLEKRYVIKTHEKTTDEIFASLKYIDISDQNRNLLQKILLLADLVKFAKEKPLPPENEQAIQNALDFVEGTQRIEIKGTGEGDIAHV